MVALNNFHFFTCPDPGPSPCFAFLVLPPPSPAIPRDLEAAFLDGSLFFHVDSTPIFVPELLLSLDLLLVAPPRRPV